MTVGETIHVNHDSCPAGVDTRRRLYITRKMQDNGRVTDLAYCHNCGSGWADNSSITNARAMATAALPLAPVPGLNLVDLNLVPAGTEGFPDEARAFLEPILTGSGPSLGGGWSVDMLGDVGIGFNRDNGRLVLPIYESVGGVNGEPDEVGELLGWQERRLYGTGPKYITTDNGAPLETTVHLWTAAPKAICFVEDYLSAIRVSQSCPSVIAVPLLRYKVRAERVAELAKSRLPAIVWLDNDRPEVEKEAQHIERLWKALGNKAVGTGAIIEPKKCIGGTDWISGFIARKFEELKIK